VDFLANYSNFTGDNLLVLFSNQTRVIFHAVFRSHFHVHNNYAFEVRQVAKEKIQQITILPENQIFALLELQSELLLF